MEEIIRILLCEDQDILSDGLKNSLNREKDIKVLKIVTDSEEIIPSLREDEYDLVLTDIITKNRHNVLDVIPQIKKEFPNIKIA
ncbi:MAG: response regulator, partial [Bacilli bacterium]|nr:response regulator [Bacilli bacterium]